MKKLMGALVIFLCGGVSGYLVTQSGILNQALQALDISTAMVVEETAMEHAIKHLDPSYICPMHPQIISDEPGDCPICGMDLVAKMPEEAQSEEARKVLYWVAPMDPNYRRDEPGKSPMGMDLIPVYEEAGAEASVDVTISPTVINNMGVRTAKAQKGRLWRHINTVGYVDYDETGLSHVHLRTDGWIERLYVKSVGERVKRGSRLLDLYSPTLVNAQEEYLQAQAAGQQTLIRASRDRLRALGVSSGQIKRLHNTGKVPQTITVYARQDGIVASLKTPEGMYVKPATKVMSLADLSTVWLLAEVFEQQADWIKEGQPADVRLSYMPGRVWRGKVEYIYPDLDPKTRTLKVRLSFENPDEALKPNMYANVTLYAGEKQDVIFIPREALINTGEQQRVIIDFGEGRFAPRHVTAGMESGDSVEILEGITAGETVVTSGQFLIDSEASLKASLARMGAR